MKLHDLKSWVGLFEPINTGVKTHDLRVMDREFEVGDRCLLREYEPTTKEFTGRTCLVEITYITSAKHGHCAFSPFALHPGMGILSIRRVEALDKGAPAMPVRTQPDAAKVREFLGGMLPPGYTVEDVPDRDGTAVVVANAEHDLAFALTRPYLDSGAWEATIAGMLRDLINHTAHGRGG